jgi:hypothetical protein
MLGVEGSQLEPVGREGWGLMGLPGVRGMQRGRTPSQPPSPVLFLLLAAGCHLQRGTLTLH